MGGTGLRARCSPCAAANPVLIASDAEAAGRARGCSNCNQRRDLLTEGSGRRSLPPAQFDAIGERSMAVPWREATTRFGRICDHARGHRRGRSRHAVSVSAGVDDLLDATGAIRKRRAQSAPSLHRPSHSIVRFAVARSRRCALLRPRVRAAGRVDHGRRPGQRGQGRVDRERGQA